MAMAEANARSPRSGINVTPLIDVLLVLLIIFMVIQPTAQHGLDALASQPPKTRDVDPDPRTVVIAVQGTAGAPRYALNQEPVALAELAPRLAELVRRSDRRTFFVAGAADLDYAAVAPVFDAAKAAGAQNVGVLTPATLAGR